ncbi:uncharacterized protein [Bactrocera oleae]|uniref:uncharacterized protein n=1 Tax=Bactrocera oleae TaxID=104688 RepID=UPI00387EE42C
MQLAKKTIIKIQQNLDFYDEIRQLKNNKVLDRKNKLSTLYPFVDEDGILRVGGRLQNSQICYDTKHPIILTNCELANLIIQEAHKITLHGGINLMRTHIRKEYWIIRIKSQLKQYVRKCVRCIRYSQEVMTQLMGNLPSCRVIPSHPFYNTGVDYAGPFQIRCSKGRGQKSYKGYIAVFVCMATKAIHLETVSDLSTESFLAALRRFFARRGKSANMYSDNGTNFVGAARCLDKDLKLAIANNSIIAPIMEKEGIKWHFIPPASPHFGGIWEAGVKSMKYHLKRIIGDNTLTYEELTTLLTQIEAVLNSRPLYTTGEDCEDNSILTPGHFLIGRSLVSAPEPFQEGNLTTLDRWNLLQKMRYQFWKNWKEEYLHTLQQRYKWKQPMSNIKEGQIVLLKNETSHPAKWPMGKITEIHKGSDGMVRVVTIQTQDSDVKRPISKICPLYSEEERKNFQQEYSKTCRSRRITTTSAVICMLLLMQTAMAAMIGGDVRVKEIPSKSAIYLEEIGMVDIERSTWNLVVYYNMEPYFHQMKGIADYITKLKKQCHLLTNFESSCEMINSALEKRLNALEMDNNLLLQPKRTRRAPFEFIGTIHHILFGTMDADDRKELEQDLTNLLDNEKNLKQLIQKQTSVIDSSLNIMKKSQEEVRETFVKMNGQLNLFYSEIIKNLNAEKMALIYQMMVTQLGMTLTECENIQSSIINLLIDINHGHLNPQLLRPAQMREEISKIKSELPPKLKLMGAQKDEILKNVYNLMRGKGIIIDNRVVIKTTIPLFAHEASTLYRVIPIPFQHDEEMMVPIIKGSYLIYNFGLDAYILLQQAELNRCDTSLDNNYICKGNWPWNPSSDQSCEISVLRGMTTKNCFFKKGHWTSYWIKLQTGNSWLYNIFSDGTIDVECSKSKEFFNIPAKGIMELGEGCTGRYKGVILAAPQHYHTQKLIEAPVNQPMMEVNEVPIPQVIVQPETLSTSLKNIKELQNIVKQIRKENIELKEIKIHHVTGHVSLVLFIIGVLVAIIIYYRLKTRQRLQAAVTFPRVTFAARENVQN